MTLETVEETPKSAKKATKKAAKKATKKTAAVAGKKTAARGARNQKRTFLLLEYKPEKAETLPIQAQGILKALKKTGKKAGTETLLKALADTIETRQPAARVLSFYQTRLVAEKFIKIEKAAA